ncbi:MAG: GAF domain-containing protein [Chloroflexi bacterium]|nr:GAF domain-containing protein [Chloroflexota bacterium]
MPSFYAAIHEIVRELMYADNFYIALYDDRREMISFPFYRDEVDLDIPDPTVWEPIGTGQAAGLTGYLLRAGKPMLMSREEYRRIVARGEAAEIGVVGTDWMGTPLRADGRTIGAVVTQSYRDDRRHSPQDLMLARTAIARFGGAEIKTEGDSSYVVQGSLPQRSGRSGAPLRSHNNYLRKFLAE